MKKSTTLLMLGGGIAALYLYSKSQANAATAAQSQASTAQNAANQQTYQTAISTAGGIASRMINNYGGSGGGSSGQPNYGRSYGGLPNPSGTSGYYTGGGGYEITGLQQGNVYVAPGQQMVNY